MSFDLFEIVQVVAAFQQRVAIRLAGVGKEGGPSSTPTGFLPNKLARKRKAEKLKS